MIAGRIEIWVGDSRIVERDNVPDVEACAKFLAAKLHEWCTIIGAIHEGQADAVRKREAETRETP